MKGSLFLCRQWHAVDTDQADFNGSDLRVSVQSVSSALLFSQTKEVAF